MRLSTRTMLLLVWFSVGSCGTGDPSETPESGETATASELESEEEHPARHLHTRGNFLDICL